MKKLAALSVLALSGSCGYRVATYDRPGETPIPSESAVRIARLVQSKSTTVRLSHIKVNVGSSPDTYIQGLAPSTAEVQTFLKTLAKDSHLDKIVCEWGTLDKEGASSFGLRAPLHIHFKAATLAEITRVPPPGLEELLNSMRTHDRDGRIAQLSRLRMMWNAALEHGWSVVYYEYGSEFAQRDVPLDSLLGLFEALEAHYPTLRIAHLELRLKDGVPESAVGRLYVYVPPPRR